ncbi:hypothetical protein TTHERM_000130009 (macronuclear) [Tetrahymena thermophila SB210]|uniref:Uncharacterized protein n=1 Tax=Tetrahymena thermophila (strain SB210) TaxID=312017 RepID=W7XJS9_TETTS|nr:hypothetical protein TTHERM_000130009 [Tetrahymena thermophila SB210]EWS74299.1 hypothetical protein TTHERM_000130009 [Tetrahymena thermophila SB210]|eukprot:XP_012653120.1 hypothetical protein TTHERM_000130009 [Tetrahymena thermophila SB210]
MQEFHLDNLNISSLQNKTENEEENVNVLHSFQNTQLNFKTKMEVPIQNNTQQCNNEKTKAYTEIPIQNNTQQSQFRVRPRSNVFGNKQYQEALYYYESAIIYCFIDMGFANIQQFMDSLKKSLNNLVKSQEEEKQKIIIVCISLILLSHTIKEAIIDRNDVISSEVMAYKLFEKMQTQKCLLDQAIKYTEIVLDLIQYLKNKNLIEFTDDIIIITQANYLELKIHKSPIEQLEKLVNNLEQKLSSYTNHENGVLKRILIKQF